MLYKGYKIRTSCADWEQVDVLDRYYRLFYSRIAPDKLVGLGLNWADNYFDYAIGTIDDPETVDAMRDIDFSKTEFENTEYIEIDLPEIEEWEVFRGKEDNLRQIYEQEIDCYNRPYDYELEYLDGKGNCELKIHYTDN